MTFRPSTAVQVASRHRRHRSASPGGTLRSAFDTGHNHVTLMRLGLAALVAFVHALAVGFGHQPAIGETQLGDLGVDAFFVLSGFLITASYLRLDSTVRYAWHRFLRIMPAFWVCLILTAALLAPILAAVEGRAAWAVFTASQDSALDYLVANAALMMRQYGIAGLPTGVPQPGVLDGALWTLFYEAVCYAGVIVLAGIGALRRRPWLTLMALAAAWGLVACDALGIPVLGQERMTRFTMLFLVGAAAWIMAHRVPIRGTIAAAALAVLTASLLLLPEYVVLGGPALAYLCLWLAVQRPPARPLRRDLSYGLYIYHWPIEQILVVTGVAAWGRPAFVAVALALAMVAATASWHLVERPALSWKDATWIDRLALPRRRRPDPPDVPERQAPRLLEPQASPAEPEDVLVTSDGPRAHPR